MAVGRQEQSNVMLYTAITFVALFIIAAVAAVIFYIKTNEWRDQYLTNQQQLNEIATSSEVQNLGNLVGQKEQTSRVSQLLGYIDKLYTMNIGLNPKEASAEVKLGELQAKYKDITAALPKDFAAVPVTTEANEVNEANGPGIFNIVDAYNNKLNQKNTTITQLNKQLDDLGSQFDTARAGAAEREKSLLLQLHIVRQDANNVQQSYNELRDLMDKKADEQIRGLMKQREDAIADRDKSKKELLDNMSKLSLTQTRLQESLSRLDVLKPRPKEDVAAFQPDGHVITVDIQSNIVFIDIGNESKVYPGLTFAVYDRSAPIPSDGSSKGEIEIFNVDKSTATARIVKASKKNPIAEGDIIINLIWDSKSVNRFVVAGDFDFNGDGQIDADGAAKIKQLIENWGGKVEDTVTIDTDFVVLGVEPQVKKKPTLDEIEADPLANEKYETSVKATEKYKDVKAQAKDLYIPVFNLKRFLSFIGYESLATTPKQK